jgi:NADH-quinone oxidoreductase subunit H
VVNALFYILVFPGLFFLTSFSMLAEWVDRVLVAKMQNRVGPPWFQPLADFIKLAAKEDILPDLSDKVTFRLMPIVALASAAAAILYIPLWSTGALLSFEGDIIVILYLLTIPTVTFFLGGWYSRSVFSMIGAARTIMQMFAYEIPLFLSILAPAVLAGSWSLHTVTAFYAEHPLYALLNVIGLCVAPVALLGKLERVPFDIPEAETEIVAGSFTEYSGRRLAFFRLATNVEMIVGSSLIAAVFLPFGLNFGELLGAELGLAAGVALYLVKVMAVVMLLAVLRTVFARLRIDQMINFCWKYVAPAAFVQLLIDLAAKKVLMP